MKTKYDWSNVPSEVKWIATDADGKKHGYLNKRPIMTSWTTFWHYINDRDFFEIGLESEFKGDWQDSLEERP